MKKIATVMVILGAFVFAEYPTKTTLIMMDEISIPIQYQICVKRSQIEDGSYLERFFNLKGINHYGAAWHWDGCNWQKTTKKCQYKMIGEDVDGDSLKPSSLKQHYTFVKDREGDVLINCSLDNNYDLGDGFNEYNDMQILFLRENYIIAYGFTMYEAGREHENWWIRTPNEVIVKENYPFSW